MDMNLLAGILGFSFGFFFFLILPAFLFCLFLRKVKKSIAEDKERADLKRQKETELLQAQIDYYNAQKQALEKKEQEASE